MDSINVDKIQALKKYKQQEFINSLIFYPLVALTCVILCTTPFWFPCLYSSTTTFIFISLPKILTLFFNAKSLFILGNLIVVFLLKESKIKPSKPRKLDEKEIDKRQSSPLIVENVENFEELEVMKICEENDEKSGNESEVLLFEDFVEEISEMEGLVCDELLAQDLNKRAEDFIAMVNKQIRLEANHDRVLLCSC